MDLTARLDLGELRLRTLVPDDADLVVEATRHEQGRARAVGDDAYDQFRRTLQHLIEVLRSQRPPQEATGQPHPTQGDGPPRRRVLRAERSGGRALSPAPHATVW